MYKFVESQSVGGLDSKKYVTVRDKIINEEQYVLQKHEKHQPIVEFYFHELVRHQTKRNRLFDLSIALIGILLLAVLSPLIALGVKLSTKRSVLLKRKCIGYRGGEFLQYKFRTSHNEELEDEPNELDAHHGSSTQEVFPFGRFLKKIGFDKLPQLINVLKGEMNLVGPYALSEGWTNYFNTIFKDFYKRYAVRPGITGLSQIKKYDVESKEIGAMKNVLQADTEYLKMKKGKNDILLYIKAIFK